MKKLNLWLFASLFAAAFTLTACSSSDSDGDGTTDGGQSDGSTFNPDNPRYAEVFGVVYYNGIGLTGVNVAAGTLNVNTGYNGAFFFQEVSGNVLEFKKEGYATLTRKINGGNEHYNIIMTEQQITPVPAKSPQKVIVTGTDWTSRVEVELPGKYKDAVTGAPYTGSQVQVKSVYITPDDEERFAKSMPGDLSAVRDEEHGKEQVQLLSLGMLNVELTGDDGQALQLDEDAELKFPIPETYKNRDGVTPPLTMPLWAFNESTALWEEEGEAKLAGDYYIGKVKHFSWHNLDSPALRATLKVKVLDSSGKAVANIPVDFDGQREMYTDKDGVASCVVPSMTPMTIRVKSSAYGNYTDGDASKEITQKVELNAGENKTITLKLPAKAPIIKGVVTNSGGGSKVCTLWISYNGWEETNRVVSDLDGTFTIPGPATYRGQAKVYALFADGTLAEKTITITDDDQRVDFAVSNTSGGAGVIQVTGPDGLNAKYVLPKSQWDGVSVSEGSLSFSGDLSDRSEGGDNQAQWGSFSFNVSNYSESTTSYTGASFNYMLEGSGGWVQIDVESAPATVTKNNGLYTFKMNNANGTLMDRNRGIESQLGVKVSFEFSAK